MGCIETAMQRSETQFVKNAVNILVLRTPRTLKVRITHPDMGEDSLFPYLISLGEHDIHGEVKNNELLEESFKKDVEEGELSVWFHGLDNKPTVWQFDIQQEPHKEEIQDIQSRLNALSYYCGPVDGIIGPRTRAGLRNYQIQHNLIASGEINEESLNQIKAVYGC